VPIKAIEPFAVGLPMVKPLIMAGEEVRRADNVLVRLESEDGLIGWGEAAAAPTMTGETLAGVVAAAVYTTIARTKLDRKADFMTENYIPDSLVAESVV